DARGALEQTAVQVENIARVGFTTGRTTQQQGDLTVGPGLLGQVVINDQGVLAAVAVVLDHGATRIGCQVLHGGRVGGAGRDDDGVLHGAVLFKLAHHGGDRRGLLSDGHVDTFDAGTLLVDDRVHGDGGLA